MSNARFVVPVLISLAAVLAGCASLPSTPSASTLAPASVASATVTTIHGNSSVQAASAPALDGCLGTNTWDDGLFDVTTVSRARLVASWTPVNPTMQTLWVTAHKGAGGYGTPGTTTRGESPVVIEFDAAPGAHAVTVNGCGLAEPGPQVVSWTVTLTPSP